MFCRNLIVIRKPWPAIEALRIKPHYRNLVRSRHRTVKRQPSRRLWSVSTRP
jgi:hypothetical protein